MRKLWITGLLLLLPIIVDAGQGPASPAAIIKKRTELVLIPAIVKDRHGVFVPGLTKDDFRVLENGKPQEIKVFEEVTTTAERPREAAPAAPNEFTNQLLPEQANRPPRLTIIAFDLINMPTLREGDARKALWDFLSETAETMEPTAVYSIGSKGVAVVVDFTTDPQLVREALLEGKVNDVQHQQLLERGFTYAGKLKLPPGDYLVRFVVRDGMTGHLGSVTAPLKIDP